MPDQRPAAVSVAETVRSHVTLLFFCVLVMWGVELADYLIWDGGLDRYGIRPREKRGLWGLVFAPLLHGGFGHLGANTIPFLVLGWCVMLRRVSDFFWVSGVTALLGGLAVWLIGDRGTVHVGASGIIFGYLGFLIFRALFERSLASLSIAVVACFLYGGLVWGLFRFEEGVSWEGHLGGFIAGAVAAGLLSSGSSKEPRT